ncbi:hypothetical protein AMTR_s00113p00079080 [Amborella trichopoda]|uniref:Uncharacterized protein n=1 Tax=Amborella trichopoda TaxID=13333 RepID=W1NTK5_AMBTC|nr:hypothetical protein AMTR_s00113p00079080 [Amborella trichopoda]
MKILCIPTALPKTEAVVTKEPTVCLQILQIPTSLKEGSNTPTLRALCPTDRLKMLQIPRVLHIKRTKSDPHELFALKQQCPDKILHNPKVVSLIIVRTKGDKAKLIT